MKGTIRARGKCPKCNKEFIHYKRAGYICPDCQTTPGRFVIDLWYNKQRLRIYSNKHGQILEGYKQADDLRAAINQEIRDHSFDPSYYVKIEQKQFWAITLLDEMLSDRIDNIAPSYRNHYRLYVTIEKAYFKTRDVREIKNYDIINFDKYLKANHYPNPNSRAKVLSHFKSFMRYCAIDRQIPLMIPKFPELDTREPEIVWINAEDQQTIFNKYIPDMHKPIMAFLMIYGCRVGEAAALKCGDVDLHNDCFVISSTFSGSEYRPKKRKGRNAKPTVKPIVDDMRDYLTDRVSNNLPEAWVFPNPRTGKAYTVSSLSRIWKRVRERANLPDKLKLKNATRTSRGSQAANSGISQKTIQQLLGHSCLSSTDKYTSINLESQRIALGNYSLKKPATVSTLSLAGNTQEK